MAPRSPSPAGRVILVPFDQLHRDRGALRDADPERDQVLLVESESMLRSRTWHAQRLHLVLSAAAHLAQELRDAGFEVHEVSARTVVDGVAAMRARRTSSDS